MIERPKTNHLFKSGQIERQITVLRNSYNPTHGHQFGATYEKYPHWNHEETEKCLATLSQIHRNLYVLATQFLPEELKPNKERVLLNDYNTQYFELRGQNVYPQVPREQIPHRLNDIFAIIATIRAKKSDMTRISTVKAYGAAALTFISLHGILGHDGHGRAAMSLEIPISAAADQAKIYANWPYIESNGDFNERRYYANVFLNDPFTALRMRAGKDHMNKYGDIPIYLRDPDVIWSPTASAKATFRAAYDLATDLLLNQEPVSRATRKPEINSLNNTSQSTTVYEYPNPFS